MSSLRAWLLMTLAAGNSVVLNSIIDASRKGNEPQYHDVVIRGKTYQIDVCGSSVLEVKPGALIAGCTIIN